MFAGCKNNPPATTFNVSMQQEVNSPETGLPENPPLLIPMPNAQVNGQWVVNDPSVTTAGNVKQYSGYTNVFTGIYTANNLELPAYWNHEAWFPLHCALPDPPVYIVSQTISTSMNEFEADNQWGTSGETLPWECLNADTQTPYASSRFAITGSIPSSVTLGSLEPYSSTYGMPLLYVYSGSGGNPSLVTTITATSVASDGSTATFPLPSSLAESGYGLITENKTSSSEFSANGFNFYSIAQSQTIAGSPFGVSVGAQTTETITCTYVEEGNPPHQTTQCATSSSNPDTIPVISLYSANQVMIGSTLVNVGANPTAVGTYAVSPVTSTTSNGSGYVTTILSGSLRAIVANSGSNTVTILNTVTNAPVATVTVGNQPVALTVDSAAGYAYVANYTDSTISRVNLSTNTAAGTVTVGGHPTSVALTSGGTLWVGGVGFLTEINTSTMTATATEAISGKTIVGLGYSNSVGQIVATTVDSSNNVYIDQIAPSSVTAGGTYTTVASNQVSNLGTHVNTHTQAQVRAFTNTLASQSILNTNQPGAPPLVVQDGWAVVTATPTGFSITDITGKVVLVSEQTPSPITAIAVDPNLNVVYLTMPDSNTLLKVPLPGTN
jgi:YVTN family beta-propeller protein